MAKILETGKGSYKISEHSTEIGVKEQQQGWKLFVHIKHCDTVPLTAAELEKKCKKYQGKISLHDIF